MALVIVAIVLGYCIIKQFFKIENIIMIISGSFLIGSLVTGTLLYILDVMMINIFGSYTFGNLVFFTFAILYIVLFFYLHRDRIKVKRNIRNILKDRPMIIMLIFFIIYSFWLNYYTFGVKTGDILIRGGAWSDIMYHNSYMRSVELGSNIPTTYPYYANTPIHYHFMYDYFGGKISQFGLNTVHSLNLLSSLGLSSLLILLFEFGRVYFKSVIIGLITPILLIFHSSAAAFTWLLKDNYKIDGWLNGVNFEKWGLFNFNVFINQRHFAFALAICAFIVLYIIIERESSQSKVKKNEIRQRKDKDTIKYLPIAFIIGLLPFWNAIIAVISIVFVGLLGVSEVRRNTKFTIGLVFSAVVAGLLVLPQILLFSSGDTALSQYPIIHFGYEIDNLNIFSFLNYYYKVLGVKFILIIVAFFIIDTRKKIDYLIFIIPFVLANTVQFGKILYDNNKFMIVWIMFVNVYAAFVISNLYKLKDYFYDLTENTNKKVKASLYKILGASRLLGIITRFIAVVAFISVILAGVIDLFAVKNMQQILIRDGNSELKQWIVQNTPKDSVFLTSGFIPYNDNGISAITLSGRMLYCVRNDVDSSLNIQDRMNIIRKIYTFEGGINNTIDLLKKEKINFILVDNQVMNSADYKYNQEAFNKNFTVVFNNSNEYEGKDIKIYKLK